MKKQYKPIKNKEELEKQFKKGNVYVKSTYSKNLPNFKKSHHNGKSSFTFDEHRDIETMFKAGQYYKCTGKHYKESIDKLRPAVKDFAKSMELRLREFDSRRGKTGWTRNTCGGLTSRLNRHIRRLEDTVSHLSIADTRQIRQKIRNECRDIANYTMMIYDKINKKE